MKPTVIDTGSPGGSNPLNHNTYAIVYTPSWIRVRDKFKWRTTMDVMKSVTLMKEYFESAHVEERPIRAQRCLYVLKSLRIYGQDKFGNSRYTAAAREMLSKQLTKLSEYLELNPVVAWDWIVSWAESGAMAEAYPKEFVRMFRRLRSRHSTKRKPKRELLYFITIMTQVARDNDIDLERKWNT